MHKYEIVAQVGDLGLEFVELVAEVSPSGSRSARPADLAALNAVFAEGLQLRSRRLPRSLHVLKQAERSTCGILGGHGHQPLAKVLVEEHTVVAVQRNDHLLVEIIKITFYSLDCRFLNFSFYLRKCYFHQ